MTEAVDKTELLERIENDLDFLADALDVYREDRPGLISQMRESLLRRDGYALGYVAHTLKGLFSNFAAHPAVETAIRLQAMVSQGDQPFQGGNILNNMKKQKQSGRQR